MSKEENKENNDTKKLLEMSLDDIVKMNKEKRRKNNFSFKKISETIIIKDNIINIITKKIIITIKE